MNKEIIQSNWGIICNLDSDIKGSFSSISMVVTYNILELLVLLLSSR